MSFCDKFGYVQIKFSITELSAVHKKLAPCPEMQKHKSNVKADSFIKVIVRYILFFRLLAVISCSSALSMVIRIYWIEVLKSFAQIF